jgi:hypothetical protein
MGPASTVNRRAGIENLFDGLFAEALIRRRPVYMVDNEDVDKAFLSFQLEPELLL